MTVIEKLALYSATVHNDSDITVINGVEFPLLYDSIIPQEAISFTPISGKKTFFAGLQTEKIQVN